MIVREHRPGFVDPESPPREQRVGILLEVLGIPWLAERGRLEIRPDGVYAGEELVATVHREGE